MCGERRGAASRWRRPHRGGPRMITQIDLAPFMTLVRRDNQGTTGWTRSRSSLRFTLDAIDAYNRQQTLANFNAIVADRNAIRAAKQTQYAAALQHLDTVLAREQDVVSGQELVRRLADNAFRVSSGLEEYRDAFGKPFVHALTDMQHTSRWLDGGSGEAKAMIEYLEAGGKGRCTATGYAVPANGAQSGAELSAKHGNRFEYIQGKYCSEISKAELDWPGGGDFRLITDLNGVLYYTPSLVEDLTLYLHMLANDGVLLFTSVEAKVTARNATFDERRIPGLAKWASNIGGVKLTMHTKSHTIFYEVSRTGRDVVVPPMTRTKYQTLSNNNAPIREYDCTLALPNNPTMM